MVIAIASTVSRESYVMAFNDCYYFVGFALLLSGVAVLFLRRLKSQIALAAVTKLYSGLKLQK